MQLAAIVFDMNGTLCNYWEAANAAQELALQRLAALGADGSLPAARRAYDHHEPQLVARYESGDIDMEQLRRLRFELPLRDLGLEPGRAAREAAGLHETYTRATDEALALFPDVEPALSRLGRDFRLALASNGPADNQERRLRRLGIAAHFDDTFFSSTVGHAKPAPQFFQAVARGLQLPPGAILMAGDDLRTDVAGALDAGLWAAWINRAGEPLPPDGPRPHYNCPDLGALARHLDEPSLRPGKEGR